MTEAISQLQAKFISNEIASADEKSTLAMTKKLIENLIYNAISFQKKG